jgi:hypothetical protein
MLGRPRCGGWRASIPEWSVEFCPALDTTLTSACAQKGSRPQGNGVGGMGNYRRVRCTDHPPTGPEANPRAGTSSTGMAKSFALDDLPGTIAQRELVQDSDSGDEDDFGTFALLKTGNEKKAALKEKERRKNLQSMEIGGKAVATEAPEAPAVTVASPTPSPKQPSPKATAGAKRPRRGPGAGRASRSKAAGKSSPQVHDLDGEEELDEADRRLAQSNRENDERQRRMREQLRALDDDDDDEPSPAARGAGARGSSSSGRSAAFAPEHLWLTIVAGRDGQGTRQVVRCLTSQPLEAKLVHRIASDLGYLLERTSKAGPVWPECQRGPKPAWLAEGG